MDASQPAYIKSAAQVPQVVWKERPLRPAPLGTPYQPTQAPSPAQPVPAQQLQQQQQPRSAGDQAGEDESVSEALSKDVFSTYVCRSLQRGIPHPGDIAEASGLRYIIEGCEGCDLRFSRASVDFQLDIADIRITRNVHRADGCSYLLVRVL